MMGFFRSQVFSAGAPGQWSSIAFEEPISLPFLILISREIL